MKIITKSGQPFIVSDCGTLLSHAAGIKAIRKRLDLNTSLMGDACGVSGRTVENWEQGRPVPKSILLLLKTLLESRT